MDYQLVFAPTLHVNTQAFVDAWNTTPACRDLAEAQRADAAGQDFAVDPQMVQQGLVLLGGFVGGLALDAVKDVVKEKLAEFLKDKLQRKPQLQVQAVRQPDGAYLLVVTEEG